MHNFNEKHPHVIENVECRCKICEESILKSQKGQDADAIVHDRQAEKHLQVQRKASRRYVGPQKSICNREYQASADTTIAIKSICNSEYQGIADTSQSKKKTMQSSELESGLPDEAEQECIVFFLLGGRRELNSK